MFWSAFQTEKLSDVNVDVIVFRPVDAISVELFSHVNFEEMLAGKQTAPIVFLLFPVAL